MEKKGIIQEAGCFFYDSQKWTLNNIRLVEASDS